jgi:hypothetical protein
MFSVQGLIEPCLMDVLIELSTYRLTKTKIDELSSF